MTDKERTQKRMTFEEQSRKTGFPMVSTAVIYYPKISPGAKVAYTILCAHAYGKKDTCFPSMNRIAFLMGRTRASIVGYVRELQNNKLLDVIPGNRRAGQNNTYILTRVPQHIVDHYWEVQNSQSSKPANC